jgi:predicted dehydrogenase
LRDLIHEIDYAGWLFGWPTSLHARLVNTGTLGIDAEESADLSWETKDGITVTLRLDYLTRPSRRRMTVCGRNGTWTWDGISNFSIYENVEGACERMVSTQTRDQMLTEQATAFLAVKSGQINPCLTSGLDGIHAILICDAARRAALSRREESVENL